jgi:hypothetical protein
MKSKGLVVLAVPVLQDACPSVCAAAAVAQIGEQTTEVRIGGIYALERIARDSNRGSSSSI